MKCQRWERRGDAFVRVGDLADGNAQDALMDQDEYMQNGVFFWNMVDFKTDVGVIRTYWCNHSGPDVAYSDVGDLSNAKSGVAELPTARVVRGSFEDRVFGMGIETDGERHRGFVISPTPPPGEAN